MWWMNRATSCSYFIAADVWYFRFNASVFNCALQDCRAVYCTGSLGSPQKISKIHMSNFMFEWVGAVATNSRRKVNSQFFRWKKIISGRWSLLTARMRPLFDVEIYLGFCIRKVYILYRRFILPFSLYTWLSGKHAEDLRIALVADFVTQLMLIVASLPVFSLKSTFTLGIKEPTGSLRVCCFINIFALLSLF